MLICKFNWCVHTYIHTVHIAGRYRFVSERARSGHDSDLPLLVYVSGHDADLALARLDDARAVRADQAALALLPQQILHLQTRRQTSLKRLRLLLLLILHFTYLSKNVCMYFIIFL
jgi:hypothetical protein